jgi:hypothetical protein
MPNNVNAWRAMDDQNEERDMVIMNIRVDVEKDDFKVVVEDICDHAKTLGIYLAEAAHAIARDYKEEFAVFREDEDMFAEICDGFFERATSLIDKRTKAIA